MKEFSSVAQRESDGKARALAVRCPRCRAVVGHKCWSVLGHGKVDYYHQERYDAAERARMDQR